MCETMNKSGCCPLNYNCDKPLTEECWQKCLDPLPKERDYLGAKTRLEEQRTNKRNGE